MTVDAFDGRAARRPVSDLVSDALRIVEHQGRVPPRYVFMRDLKIGPKKADELLELLETEKLIDRTKKDEKMKEVENDLPQKDEKMKAEVAVSRKDESTTPVVLGEWAEALAEVPPINSFEDEKDEEMKEVEDLLARKDEKFNPQAKRGMSLTNLRWAVRGVLTLGVLASIAGNVLHANNGDPISQIISAWSPIALLLSIELVSHVPVHTVLLVVCRWSATAIIAGVAAWVSYWHMAAVASHYGETNGAQYLLPLSVDGLVVVASICLVEIGGQINASRQRKI